MRCYTIGTQSKKLENTFSKLQAEFPYNIYAALYLKIYSSYTNDKVRGNSESRALGSTTAKFTEYLF